MTVLRDSSWTCTQDFRDQSFTPRSVLRDHLEIYAQISILAGLQEPFAVPGKEPGCKVISPWASPPAGDLNPYSFSLWHSGKSAPRVCGNWGWTTPNPSDREWPLPRGHTCPPLPPHFTPTSLPVPLAPPCSRDTCPSSTRRQLNTPLASSWSWGAGF